MKTRNRFTVTFPPITFWLCLCILGFFIILVLANTIFSPPPHTAMYVCITIFVFIPVTLVALLIKMFRIKVSGTRISVRKGLGLVNFNLDISEISEVDWKTVITKMGRNNVITIRTISKRFSIETLMVGSGKMETYISENVDSSKIKKRTKIFKNALDR